jgi:hypothetical protein
VLESGTKIASSTGQLRAFGPSHVAEALHLHRSGMHMGTREGQDALIDLLVSIRAELLPGELEVDRETVRGLLFERPVVPKS